MVIDAKIRELATPNPELLLKHSSVAEP